MKSDDIKIVVYDTPEALLQAYFGAHPSEVGEVIGNREDGVSVSMNAAGMIATIEEMGYWGYADSTTNTVHVWTDGKVDHSDLMFFLGHEVGHLTGTQDPDHMTEEARADQYGEAAQTAWQMMQDVLRQTEDKQPKPRAPEKPKLCVQCNHYDPTAFHTCDAVVNIINGTMAHVQIARSDEQGSYMSGVCGREGRYWEPKE